MPESRNDYLSAMGIVRWRLRDADTQIVLNMDSKEPRSESEESSASTSIESTQNLLRTLQQTVANCTRCELCSSRTQTVFGVGNPDADWMFVGEAPGAEEDRQGLPFVGRAGKLLDAMLKSVGSRREDIYIANVLKCRPPNNRDPQGEEVKQCEPYLHQQVEWIKPKLLVAMGRFAAQSLLKTTRPISKLRGEVFEYGDYSIPLIVTYHPAYLLRNPADKRKVWQDLCSIKQLSDSL